ncbi:MAG: glycerol kinase [Planctomycetota bacterium]|nr:MAG: glycerol kinase [Planctomycetota bacterium]
MPEHVIAIDAGTTGIRVNAYDRQAQRVHSRYREFAQHYPQPGWVEHDAEEIWSVTRGLLQEVVREVGGPAAVAGIGITNQRETALIWERQGGRPLGRAIVWQDRRTRDLCQEHEAAGHGAELRRRTGLLLDAYFSGTKLQWLIRHHGEIRRRVRQAPEELCCGTIDSWLAFRLSGGRAHVTDPTNASRTLLYDIEQRCFCEDLAALFELPPVMLPRVVGSAEVYGESAPELLGAPVPLGGIAGDQQAALFGQGCVEPGSSKNTYGTGCFALIQCGSERPAEPRGLVTTIACGPGGEATYALEGSVFIAGAVVQWLRDGLGVLQTAAESESLARSVPDSGGVYFVPAFAGLGAPYWDMDARGAILGLTRGSTRAHIVRAALEAICYQSRDLLEALEAASGREIPELRIDGGAVENALLCQLQADLLGKPCVRPADIETTARGAAFLCGLATGFWGSFAEIEPLVHQAERRFEPGLAPERREALYRGWQQAVARVRSR